MSYLLAREGQPPFVLSVENAKAYFDPSTLVQGIERGSLRMLIRLSNLKKRFACLLEDTADRGYLIPLT